MATTKKCQYWRFLVVTQRGRFPMRHSFSGGFCGPMFGYCKIGNSLSFIGSSQMETYPNISYLCLD